MTEECYGYYLGLMDTERRERVQKKPRREDRLCSVAADMLLRKALSEDYGINEEDISILEDECGAPYVDAIAVRVSISHSGDYAVCAVSRYPVGIDIEKIRPISTRVSERTFSENEKKYLSCKGELSGEALLHFFEIWTAKEAYGKMKGEGIALSDTVDTTTIQVKREYFDGYVVSIVCEQ